MKISKRIFSSAVAFCLALSLGFSAFAAFVDVADDSPYKAYISQLSEKGIIKGYSEDSFAPDDLCTREQFMTFLYRAAGEPEAGKIPEFSDVAADAYYAPAVAWAYNNDITNGAGEGAFGVGKTVDRNLATFYLYKWALATDNGDIYKSCYLTEYEDGADVALYARTSYPWAIGNGVVEVDGTKLEPLKEVSRGWVIGALGKLVCTHYHVWSDYKDNGDGTHTRICLRDESHIETAEHTFNAGELTKAATEAEAGEITYTCTACGFSKKEAVAADKEVITRADLEEAIVQTAWAYYVKGPQIQYDSTHFGRRSGYHGGMCRLTAQSPPEMSTKDNTFYSVCSDYTSQVYLEGLNMYALSEVTYPFGLSTSGILKYAENQRHTVEGEEMLNEPLEETDVDAAIATWIDFDRHSASRIKELYMNNAFESSSYEDNFNGLSFEDDGPDGAPHYSYYDENGNKLTPNEAKEKYVIPFLEDYEKNLRPGDFLNHNTHAMLYVGNNTILHVSGSKIDQTIPQDKIEGVDADLRYPEGTNYVSFANGAMYVTYDNYFAERIRLEKITHAIVARPLEHVVTKGFDADPGNDIVTITIPEETKSRIKYPLMDIDRTVDITSYGSAVPGGELTYTVEIENHTSDARYKKWYERFENGSTGEVTYKGIKVEEKVPAGTELIEASVTGGGKIDGENITWELSDIAPGEKVTLTYTVKVTAKTGDVIVSEGGKVDNIPSNCIKNTVGAEKLSQESLAKLSAIAQGGAEKLAAYGTDTDFAESIYKEIGKTLDIPNIKDITDNLFPYQIDISGSSAPGGGLADPSLKETKLFIRQAEVPEAYKHVQSMLIDRYWGGSIFFVGNDRKWDLADNYIKEFRTEYLEPGDIIVYYEVVEKTDVLGYEPKRSTVMVYDGKNLLCAEDNQGEVKYNVFEGEAVDAQLLKAFIKAKGVEECHLFFALRPTQAE